MVDFFDALISKAKDNLPKTNEQIAPNLPKAADAPAASTAGQVFPQQTLMKKPDEAEEEEELWGEEISPQVEECGARLYEKMMKALDLRRLAGMEDGEARKEIRQVATQMMDEGAVPLNTAGRQLIIKQIQDEILGLGPLEPLLTDSVISDILVNGAKSVYIEVMGKLRKTRITFRDDDHLRNIIDRIVGRVGRRIDELSPMVDARLPDGSRVNAIIAPLALDGPTLSIRRFAVQRLQADELVRIGSASAAMMEVLRGIVKCRLNVLISGGTGSGKTTLLNILSNFIPRNERILSIEDSAELQIQQPHKVRLETRPPNIEGKGEVMQRDLVRNALRMRPDRIILGEVRGAEAVDMLQAMNTGHDGSLSTIHANTPRDALSRLETMIMMANLQIPIRAMRTNIASALNVIIQTERMEDGQRRITSIQEIQGMEGEVITMSEIFKFQRTGVDNRGMVLGDFRALGVVPKFHDRLRLRGVELDYHLFDPVA
jgi:pilus assembly protein CpaF